MTTMLATFVLAALIAVSKWKFTPGKLNGVPVDVVFNVTISYRVD